VGTAGCASGKAVPSSVGPRCEEGWRQDVQTRGKTGLAKVGRLRDSADCQIEQFPGFGRYVVPGPPSKAGLGVCGFWVVQIPSIVPRMVRDACDHDTSVSAGSRLLREAALKDLTAQDNSLKCQRADVLACCQVDVLGHEFTVRRTGACHAYAVRRPVLLREAPGC